MFYRLKALFTSKKTLKINSLEYEVKRLQGQIDSLKDDFEIISKLSNKKDHKLIEMPMPMFFCFGGDTARKREEAMENERSKLRQEGYNFCHKNRNGDEVWAKY